MTTPPIRHISDTARWVAVYRAMESERPDAIFHDPFARRLAGRRGEEIVAAMHRGQQMAWPMIVRTAVMDEIILRLVREAQVDGVLNLAAGLDARPYRLPLPASLLWVDADLPDILRYKEETLRGERPVCRYERAIGDLTDPAFRRTLFDRVSTEAQRVLVLTEGLLVYLPAERVADLARELHARTAFRWWLIDLASPRLLRMLQGQWGQQLSAGNAPMVFAPAEGTAFFSPLGWREAEYRSMWDEALRLRRTMPLAWLWNLMFRLRSPAKREEGRRMSGIVLLERTG
ncbi:MAG TPA: class I SAM-dependent methyltransferase [Gemmatimonadaceae bacterium]|nr:class I SAM-dependent methyltransferase [Gemmatimonadaceae bacterium]